MSEMRAHVRNGGGGMCEIRGSMRKKEACEKNGRWWKYCFNMQVIFVHSHTEGP